MIDQIRIYYECLEQADVVIKKNIDDLIQDFPNKPTISLIRLKNGRKSYKYYSKNIAPIIMWKNPDILVSVIKNKIEYPVLMAEFSNAVFTEDHELQRFDGYIAAAKNNCIYIKISPLKRTSGSSHGGNTNFDHVGPYSLIYKKFKRIFFHFDCECNDNGDVIVNNDYLSCPSRLENFDLFLKSLFSFIYNTDFNKNWIKEFEEEIIKVDYFKEWKKKLETFVLPDVTELNSTRIQWNDSSKELVLKINRFGHAMDPERGMLAYYGTLYQNTVSKMIFDDKNNAWYNGTPKSKEIDNYINSNGLNNAFDYLFCFFSCLITLFPAIQNFVMPSLFQLLILILIGILGTFGQLAMTYGYKLAPVNEGSLIAFLVPVLNFFISYFIFKETLKISVISGSILIIICCIITVIKKVQ